MKQKDSTRLLLTFGMIAGPLYIIVGALEGLLRPGFSFIHHDLSILANGDFGWVHISLLILTGLLTVLAAFGMKRVLKSGIGSMWAPLLLAIYGLGLIGAGIFSADPAHGFPVGTPMDAHSVSWHGGLHLLFGMIGFAGLIAACFVLGKRFKAEHEDKWALFSRITGVYYFLAFFGIAMGSNGSDAVLSVVIILFTLAVILGWAWIFMVSRKLKNSVS